MSEGAGNDEAGGGSGSPAQPGTKQRPSSTPGQHDEPGSRDWRDEPGGRPRSRRGLALAGWIALAGLASVLILSQYGVFSSRKAPAGPTGFQPAAANPAQAARQTAQAFLAAWRKGRIRKAASYTDHPAAAAAALTSYRDGLHLSGLRLAVHNATAQGKAQGTVAFSVAATVGLPSTGGKAANPAQTAAWVYASNLVAYKKHGGWWVRWDPALVAPGLTAGEQLVSVPVWPGAAEVTDAAGGNIQNSSEVGLRNIAAALTRSAPSGQGIPGIEVARVGTGGGPIAGGVQQLSQPVATGVVKTTINPRVEAAAEAAVQAHGMSSMVVIQPSTGDILAVANNDGNNDFALTARVAPGSTNKIITSTALFATGLVKSPSQPVDCPPQIDANGEVINNAGGESEPPGTPFITDFAASCNNAFDRWYASLKPQTLAQTAEQYYGLNQHWNIGVGAPGVAYYTLPSAAADNELALELFGQGRLSAAPLAMASVAATVDTGRFRQPIVVPGLAQLAGTPLPANVHQDLWQVMRAVTQAGGTAAGVFGGVGSQVYAKTGTADVSGQGQPNSWLVAFDPTLNVAVGCLVLNAGFGAQVAGPEVANLLQHIG